MNTGAHTTRTHSGSGEGSLHAYVFGFLSSLLCTGIAFGLVEWHISTRHEFLPHEGLLFTIVILGVLQLIAQLMFFLHLGKGSSRHWNIAAFSFAILVVFIVVGGSLWIMDNLKHTGMGDMYIGGIVSPETQAN